MSSYSPVSSPNNGAALDAQLTAPTIWQKQVEHYIENADFYAPVEGGGANAIIRTKTDLSAGLGQTLKIRVESGFSDEPHFGDETFANDVDFEEALYSEYDLTIDVIRHATSFTERAEELVGLRNEIRDGIPRKLGDWLGRRKTEELDMMFTNQIPDSNRFFPNFRTSATLLSGDTLGWNYIMNTAAHMQTLGGQVGKLGTFSRDKSSAEGFAIVGCSDACTILRQDSVFVDYQKNAGVRGDMNPLFRGHVSMVDGHAVVDRRIIDSDAEGAIGSPMNPKAVLGVAIAAGTTAFDIKGGGNAVSAAKTKKKFFKYFAGYAYKFATGTTLAPASATRYVLIVNSPNAATDPGKIGMYAYTTGNDGNKITVTARLGATASGIRVTSFAGGVTWDTDVWAGRHTDQHDIGATIIPCNVKGVPLGRSFMLGRAAALRGYGKHRAKRDTEDAEGGFLQRTYLRSYFGQQLRYDRAGRVPSVAVLEHALPYPLLNLPVVTS